MSTYGTKSSIKRGIFDGIEADSGETAVKPAVEKPIPSVPDVVELRPRVNKQFLYVGFDSRDQLSLSGNSKSELQMKRFETDLKHVMRFSNLKEELFLTGRFEGDNIVRGEFVDNRSIQDEADHWYVRPVPDSNRGEVLLQFYKLGFRSSDWEELGHFFIIKFDDKKQPDFKLGDYKEAMEYGIFIIKS